MENKVILEGYVHRVTAFGQDNSVIRFKLENEVPTDDGKQRTKKNWLDCVIFRANKDILKQLNHGKTPLVTFEGSLQSSSFTKDGVKQYRQDVIVDTETLKVQDQ